jgi:2-deoxy-D-gluconate 3-dehydrogenase
MLKRGHHDFKYTHIGLVENDVLLDKDWFDQTMALFEQGKAAGLEVGAVSARCYEDRILIQRDGYAITHNTGAGMIIFSRKAAELVLQNYRTVFTTENRLLFAQLSGIDIGAYWAFRGSQHWLVADWNFDRVLAVNLRGVFLCTREAALTMVDRDRGGAIVNVTSIDALHPSMVGLAHYDASKHGAWGFTKNVALELAPHGIRVNAVAPGGVLTPGVEEMGGGSSEAVAAFTTRIPMGRMGDPDDIARAVVFLLSQSANRSEEVRKELALASSFAVPVLPVRLEPVQPVEASPPLALRAA